MSVHANEYKFLGIIPIGGLRIFQEGNKTQIYESYHGLSYVLNELGKYSTKIKKINENIGLKNTCLSGDEKWLNRFGIECERFSLVWM